MRRPSLPILLLLLLGQTLGIPTVAGKPLLTSSSARLDFPLGAAKRRGHNVAYVESSSGLIPPTMEGGRTELEMGDVNGDGHPDLVSIGDHGSPYVNTDEHGIMVWFGDGAGHWSVYQNGDFGYGGVALGDVNGDGRMDVGYGSE